MIGDIPEFQWGPRVHAAAELSAIVRDVVREHPDLILAPVETYTFGTRISTELAGDCFHPGNRGHRRMANAFIVASEDARLLNGWCTHRRSAGSHR